jgi:hypothetical protein
MPAGETKKQLFGNILRLRRAERHSPGDRDVVAVRGWLERELGPTVSQRLAAELLGVSHTALRRWISSGDLAIVSNAAGRREVPVPALLDLYEAVERERTTGQRRQHVLEPSMSEARQRARSLRIDELVGGSSGAHDRAARRNLAYHRAVARRLRRSMVDDALHQVWRWRDDGQLDPRYAREWEDVLARPIPEIRKVLTADSPESRDLRQNSPFAGVLSEPERRRILDEVS